MLRRWIRLILGLCLLGLSPLAAQDDFRIGDPQFANPNQSSWRVDPEFGVLTFSLPIGTIPGEIPIPVSFTMTGSIATRVDSGNYSKTPIFGGVNFGYSWDIKHDDSVVMADSIEKRLKGLALLEDGRRIMGTDWGSSLPANTPNWKSSSSSLSIVNAYGFDNPYASSNGGYGVNSGENILKCWWPSGTNPFGRWNTVVQQHLPTSYSLGPSYMAILDKNIARVYACFSTIN